MRGQLVIVRSYGGLPLVRRVWDEDEKGVYITNEEQLKNLLSGKHALQPVGFPREDVFKYDPKLETKIRTLHKKSKLDWEKLEPFK